MAARPRLASALLICGSIAAGLALRLAHVGLPFAIVKYGGSMLWALMIYWIVSTLRPHWPMATGALAAVIVSIAVELFKLVHAPGLDAFRLTLPGALLLGRVFSLWDLAAYAAAIALGALADRRMRPAPAGWSPEPLAAKAEATHPQPQSSRAA